VLCVAWAGGKAAACVSGRSKGGGRRVWEGVMSLDSPETVAEALRLAKQNLGYHGKQGAIILAHSAMAHRFTAVPKARPALQRRVLERLVNSDDRAGPDPAWAWQTIQTEVPGGGAGVILYLLPRGIFGSVEKGFEQAGLHLAAAYPQAVAVEDHLERLFQTCDDDVLVLGSMVETATTIVVGRREQGALFVRTLHESGVEPPPLPGAQPALRLRVARKAAEAKEAEEGKGAGLAVELRRTCLYVSQKFGLIVPRIFLAGRDAKERAPVLARRLEPAVQPSIYEESLSEWAKRLAENPFRRSANFIPPEKRLEPQLRGLSRAAAVGLVLFAMATFLGGWRLRALSGAQREALQQLRRAETDLVEPLKELTEEHAETLMRERFAQAILDEAPPPAPAWILAYMGVVVPKPLILTALDVEEQTNVWQATIKGIVDRPPEGGEYPAAAVEEAFSKMTNALATGPFRMRLVQARLGAKEKPRALLSRVIEVKGASQRQRSPREFEIKGQVR